MNTGRIIYLRNTNRLLGKDPIILSETGTTVKALQCLIGAARMEGRTLISVVLHMTGLDTKN